MVGIELQFCNLMARDYIHKSAIVNANSTLTDVGYIKYEY